MATQELELTMPEKTTPEKTGCWPTRKQADT